MTMKSLKLGAEAPFKKQKTAKELLTEFVAHKPDPKYIKIRAKP